MDKEVTLFTKPEELLQWISDNNITIQFEQEDAQLLLDYMRDHDYVIGSDSDGVMVQKDIAAEDGEIQIFAFDDVIDIVCEWNYELLKESEAKINEPDGFVDFVSEKSRYERLCMEEKRLDKMFEQTKYAKEIEVMANALAEQVIEGLQRTGNVKESVDNLVENIKSVSTGKRR